MKNILVPMVLLFYMIQSACSSDPPTVDTRTSHDEYPMPIDTFGSTTHRCENIFGKQKVFADTVYPDKLIRLEYMCDDSFVVDDNVYSKVVVFDSACACKPLRLYIAKMESFVLYKIEKSQKTPDTLMRLKTDRDLKKLKRTSPFMQFRGSFVNENSDTILRYRALSSSSNCTADVYYFYFKTNGEMIKIERMIEY